MFNLYKSLLEEICLNQCAPEPMGELKKNMVELQLTTKAILVNILLINITDTCFT
jgi:hypothetical protein